MIGSWFIFFEPPGNPEAISKEGAATRVFTCQLGVISLQEKKEEVRKK